LKAYSVTPKTSIRSNTASAIACWLEALTTPHGLPSGVGRVGARPRCGPHGHRRRRLAGRPGPCRGAPDGV